MKEINCLQQLKSMSLNLLYITALHQWLLGELGTKNAFQHRQLQEQRTATAKLWNKRGISTASVTITKIFTTQTASLTFICCFSIALQQLV